MTRNRMLYSLLFCEAFGFGVLAFFLWMDEVLDLPYLLFGQPATPVNHIESLFESLVAGGLGLAVMLLTIFLCRQIRYLEGFLPVCSFCKSIRVGERWIPIEEYVNQHAEVRFSHSCCPVCLQKEYGDLLSDSETAAVEQP